MIAIEGQADLYKLDLEVVSIDMEALDEGNDLANDPGLARPSSPIETGPRST